MSKEKATRECMDLVLDNGELVRVEYPSDVMDDIWEEIENSTKTKNWFCPQNWEGCIATYLGHTLDRINMSKVIGIL